MPDGDETEDQIFYAAERSGHLFNRLLSALSSRAVEDQDAIRDYQRRFQRWVGLLGVFAEPLASLDTRLRDSPDLRGLVLQLLQLLETNLRRVLDFESVRKHHQSISKYLPSPYWRTKTNGDRLLPASKAALDGIQGTMERLDQLASAILASTASSIEHRVRLYEETDGKDGEDAHFESIVMLFVQGLYPVSKSLADQLVASIIYRRRRLLYQRRHHEKMVTRRRIRRELPSPPQPEPHDAASPSQMRLSGWLPWTNRVRDQAAKQETPQPTNHELPEISPSILDSADHDSPVLETLTEDSSPRSSILVTDEPYPRPPQPQEGTKRCHCGWCFEEFDVSNLHKFGWWRSHFMTDLEPYVCISEECPEPNQSFTSFPKWREHMETNHTPDWARKVHTRTTWYCDLNHQEHQYFIDPGRLEEHLRSDHADLALAAENIASKVERNMSSQPREFNICPLCNQDILSLIADSTTPLDPEGRHRKLDPPLLQELEKYNSSDDNISSNRSDPGHVSRIGASLQTPDDLEAVNQLNVARHIAEHLETLAFLSIRYIEEDSISTRSDEAQLGVGDRTDNGPDPSITLSWSSALTSGYSTVESGPLELEVENTRKLKRPQSSKPKIPTTVEEFTDAIFASFVEDVFDRKEFLPEDSFQWLNTPDNINMVLSQRQVKDISPELIDFVHREAGRFFAILVYIGIDLAPAVQSLRRYNLTDQYLPISKETIEDNCDKADSDRLCIHESPLGAFHRLPWDRITLSRFHDAQWKFLTPVFSADRRHFQLNPSCILPFTQVREEYRSSYVSTIYRVEIHPGNQDILPLVDGKNPPMALKETRPDWEMTERFRGSNAFDAEAEVLDNMAKFHHPHIVISLGTFSRDRKQYFLFPWADGGNLRDFWHNPDIWPLTKDLISEVIEQLLGLADALCLMHQQLYRHGDLKPENILRFKDDTTIVGKLKISDLGLARRHEFQTELRKVETNTRMGTFVYEGPEVMMTTRDEPRSRRYDIWSMGCIIFEFIIWLWNGQDGLDGLTRDLISVGGHSAFYSIVKGDGGERRAEIQPAVRERLDHLMAHPDWAENTALGDLVRLVAERLLVIPVSGRADALALKERLQKISTRVNEDSDYSFVRQSSDRHPILLRPAQTFDLLVPGKSTESGP